MKETKLKEIAERFGDVVEDYDWEDNADNVGIMVVAANLDAYKAGVAGRGKVVIQAIVNAMIKDVVIREVIINAHDTFANFVIDSAEMEKTPKVKS